MQYANTEPIQGGVLKYSIKEKLNSFPKEEYTSTFEALRQKLDINKASMYRILNIPFGSGSSITSDQLIIISEFFNCSVDELLNKSTDHDRV